MSDFHSFFADDSAAGLDLDSIRLSWEALRGGYDVNRWELPLPFWGHRDYDHRGNQAWDALQRELCLRPSSKPMCIYMHVPFCSSKCGFCDSYSFALGPSRGAEKERYVDLLRAELDLWSRVQSLTCRPISTVHLGGGTPTFLGEELLERLAYHVLDRFNTHPGTEWALEASAASLTPSMTARMQELGFRRLHVGVQTLEDPVRRTIGRRQPAGEVQRTIRRALDLGWVVSVDLIVGLPGQTLRGALDGIRALIDQGVHGFSLYELLVYPQNRAWAARHNLLERDHLSNYWMFQAGAQFLESRGYRKNLFNHWAAPADRNVYFTFPMRGEDLLAAGCLADGVFDGYHYRHHGYQEYVRFAGAGSLGLMGGLRRTALEEELYPLILAIQSGRIDPGRAGQIGALKAGPGEPLLERWLARGLLAEESPGCYALTGSGSWFAGNMIAELSRSARESAK